MTEDLAEVLPLLDGGKDWKRDSPGLILFPVKHLLSVEGEEENESV